LSILKKIVKEVTKPIVNNHKGKVGEAKVDSKLNPLIFGKVEHKQINNLVLVDGLGKTHQIDHVEIRKNGIFCIETKNYKGWIFGSEKQDKWTQTLYTEKHQFLNPLKQNKSHIYHISNVLGSKYKINSVVVFVQNNADRIDIPNVINLNDLKRYLKDYNDGTIYSKEQIEEIYQSLINSGNKKILNREHVKNIKKTQKDLKEGICPRCGGKLVEKEGKYGKFYGCSNYPKCKFILKIK
jgi:hypothetical protein